MQINCNSLLGNFSKFVDLSDSVNNVFDAIVVSETHLDGSTNLNTLFYYWPKSCCNNSNNADVSCHICCIFLGSLKFSIGHLQPRDRPT